MVVKTTLLQLNIVEDNEYLDKYCNLIESNKETQYIQGQTHKHHIVPKSYYKGLGIVGKKDKTFAEVAKSLQKESEERPNDPISKRGLETSMSKLTIAQEILRQQNEMKKQNKNKMASGGYNTTYGQPQGDFTNILGVPTYDLYKESNYPYLEEFFRRQRATNDFPIDSLEKITTKDLVESIFPEQKGFGYTKLGEDPNVEEFYQELNKKSWKPGVEDLRYAPVLGSVLGLAHDLANKPDYSRAKKIEDLASKAGEFDPVSYTPIGNYLTYKPLDREYYLNKLNANAGATRRAIANSSSPARDAVLLAADYNTQGKIGDLMRSAEEYNLAQRQAVEQFNRGTNQANAEMRFRTDSLNRELRAKAAQQELAGYMSAMQLQDNIDAARQASIAANTSNLFNSLGNIGWEAVNRNMVNDSSIAYQIDSDGHLKFMPGVDTENINPLDVYNEFIKKGYTEKKAKEEMNKAGISTENIKSKGGYLTIKKRR
jgi:hypothetical protein